MSNSDSSSTADNVCVSASDPAVVYAFQLIVVDGAVNFLGYGCALILTILGLSTLLRRRISRTPARLTLILALLTFLICSTIFASTYFAAELAQVALGPTYDNSSALALLERVWIPMMVFGRTMYVLNDSIVVWRAWTVADHIIARIVLLVLIIGTTVCIIVESVLTIRGGMFTTTSETFNLFFIVPLIMTNLISTLIILWKTWIYRREIKIHLSHLQGGRRSQVERVLFLLIESGFLYCGVWVLFIITRFVRSFPLTAHVVVNAFIPYTAVIYPVLIILVVEHQKSLGDSTITYNCRSSVLGGAPQPIQFAPNSKHQDGAPTCEGISIIQTISEYISSARTGTRDRMDSLGSLESGELGHELGKQKVESANASDYTSKEVKGLTLTKFQ